MNFDIDGNGEIGALTDGLIIIRYLLGLTGNPLIQDAIADDATVTTADEIEAVLDELSARGFFDVDGNGEDDALTDGIIIVRDQFGLTGNPLIQDVIAADAFRTGIEQIEAFLDPLNNFVGDVEFALDLARAVDRGTLSDPQSIDDSLGVSNLFDLYKFTLDESSSVSITLSGLSADADADLFLIEDVNNNQLVGEEEFDDEVIEISFEEVGLDEVITTTLSPGDYFVSVASIIGETNYNLNLAATPVTLPDDGAGNTFVEARDIGVLGDEQTFSDFIGNADDVDIYSFSLEADSDVIAELSGLSDDADVDMLIVQDINNNGEEDDGEFIDGSFEEGNTDEVLDTFLPAGDYFLVIEQFDGESNYDLAISATEAIEIPLLREAFDLGILDNPITRSDSVSDDNPIDAYSFTVETLGEVTLMLDGLSADADLLLIEDLNGNGELDEDLLEEGEGELLNGSFSEGTTAETITEFLQPGTYFIYVEQFEGDTNYDLTLTTTPFDPGDDMGGDSIALALDLGVISQSTTVSEFVSDNDTLDYFTFTLNEQSDLEIDLEMLAGNAGIALIQDVNSDGVVQDDEIIDVSEAEGSESEFIFATDLDAGTYIVEVEHFAGDTPYDLTLNPIISTTPVDEAPDSLREARDMDAVPIPLVGPGSTRMGFVGDRDPLDLYKFRIDGDADIEISLTNLMADADIILVRDANDDGEIDSGEVISRSANNDNNDELIQANGLAPGEYFIEVAQFRGNTNYTLDISGTPAPMSIPPELPFGDSLAKAIPQSSAAFSTSGSVNPGDLSDFYRFRVTQPGIFNANLTGLTENADVILIRDYNENMLVDPVVDRNNNQFIDRNEVEIIAWQPEGGNSNESIRAFLDPGNYAIQVTSLPQKQTTDYNLTTSFAVAQRDPLAFDINATLSEAAQSSFNADLQMAVEEATEFWEHVITHSTFNGAHTIAISVDVDELGDGVLASAGPTASRKDANGRAMSTAGDTIVNINPSILSLYERDLQFFYDTMIHEFGHVLGFFGGEDALSDRRASSFSVAQRTTNLPVSLEDRNLLNTSDSENPVYNGNSFAGIAYGELLGTFEPTDLPLTRGSGSGSDLSHWWERVFRNEMMTDSGSPGINELLGTITIGAIRDLGYNVNYGAAEPYMLVM